MITQNLSAPMQVQGAPDAAGSVYQAQNQQNQNAMAAEQILQQHYQSMDAREKSRLSSTVVGAYQLKSFLDNNDLEGAQNFLTQRKSKLYNRMAYGEDIDTQETDYALQAIRDGKVDELKNSVNGVLAAGQVYGIIDRPHDNPYIQQFAAAKAAHPGWTDAQVQDYVYSRGQVGKTTVFGPDGQVINQPGAVDAAADKAAKEGFASQTGKKAGEQVVLNDNTLGNLQNTKQAVNAARAALPKVQATGPLFGRAGDAAKDVDYVNLQRDLNEITLLAKDLYNLGSGQGFTDADRDFLKELSGGSYNRADSIAYALDRFDSAIESRSKFLQQQNQRYNTQYGGGGKQPAPQQPNNNLIRWDDLQ